MGFKDEMQSLFYLKDKMSEQRLEQILKDIYIPKLKAKFNAPYLYSGEDKYRKNSYKRKQKIQILDENIVFDDIQRSEKDVILGIESSFDESAASLVNSYGEIKAQSSFTLSDVNDKFNGGIDPEEAKEHHLQYLPKAIQEVLD